MKIIREFLEFAVEFLGFSVQLVLKLIQVMIVMVLNRIGYFFLWLAYLCCPYDIQSAIDKRRAEVKENEQI
jgi:hypothetical protein